MARAVVTGAAGFVGSHFCGALLDRGYEVLGYDNFLTGRRANLADVAERPGFVFVEQDVCEPLVVDGAIDAVVHLASPASPDDYMRLPMETLLVGSRGTNQTLDLARAKAARYLLASTSEIYGDPLVHPQPEDYWGNVNSAGPRAVYDEAKRFAEAMSMAYQRHFDLDVKIVRIFNTYGPRLAPGDGRVVSNFLMQALRGEPVTVYGDGSHTRSFCYVDDEVRGIIALLESDWVGPMNIGNPTELSVLQLAKEIIAVTESASPIVYRPLPTDDPRVRQPDITLARKILGWEPEVTLREGLVRTADGYRDRHEF